VKKNRALMLRLAGDWNQRLPGDDREQTLAVPPPCVAKAALQRDLAEILNWASDGHLSAEARANHVFGLERFARKPGLARDALFALVNGREVGSAAVWALAGALKAEA